MVRQMFTRHELSMGLSSGEPSLAVFSDFQIMERVKEDSQCCSLAPRMPPTQPATIRLPPPLPQRSSLIPTSISPYHPRQSSYIPFRPSSPSLPFHTRPTRPPRQRNPHSHQTHSSEYLHPTSLRCHCCSSCSLSLFWRRSCSLKKRMGGGSSGHHCRGSGSRFHGKKAGRLAGLQRWNIRAFHRKMGWSCRPGGGWNACRCWDGVGDDVGDGAGDGAGYFVSSDGVRAPR